MKNMAVNIVPNLNILKQLALISSNNNEELAEITALALVEMHNQGNIDIEESPIGINSLIVTFLYIISN